jgi:hypothetical protein
MKGRNHLSLTLARAEKRWVLSKAESMSNSPEVKEFIVKMADGVAHVQQTAEVGSMCILCLNVISAGLLLWSVIIVRSQIKISNDKGKSEG